jgi:hypothetical protein
MLRAGHARVTLFLMFCITRIPYPIGAAMLAALFFGVAAPGQPARHVAFDMGDPPY